MCIKHVVAGNIMSPGVSSCCSSLLSLSLPRDVVLWAAVVTSPDPPASSSAQTMVIKVYLRSAACRRIQRLYEWKRHVISLNGDLAPSAGHQTQHKTEKLQSVKQPCISNMLWSVMKSVTSSASKSSELHRSLHRQLRSDWFINVIHKQ